jgi:hypothetical protein
MREGWWRRLEPKRRGSISGEAAGADPDVSNRHQALSKPLQPISGTIEPEVHAVRTFDRKDAMCGAEVRVDVVKGGITPISRHTQAHRDRHTGGTKQKLAVVSVAACPNNLASRLRSSPKSRSCATSSPSCLKNSTVFGETSASANDDRDSDCTLSRTFIASWTIASCRRESWRRDRTMCSMRDD